MRLPSEEILPAETTFSQLQSGSAALEGITDAELVRTALRAVESDWGGSGDTWPLLCRADPVRAVRGAIASGIKDTDLDRVLLPLISSAQQSDVEDLDETLCELLLSLQKEVFTKSIGMSTCLWIWQRLRNAPPGTKPLPSMIAVWDRVAEGMLHSDGPDFLGERNDDVLDKPGGILALALLTWISKRNWSSSEGFGPEILPRLNQLATAPGAAGLQARILLVRDLSFLGFVDPNWVIVALVPKLSWGHAEASSLWSAHAGRKILTSPLFNALKPSLLQAVETVVDTRVSAQLAIELLQVAHRFRLQSWRNTTSRGQIYGRRSRVRHPSRGTPYPATSSVG